MSPLSLQVALAAILLFVVTSPFASAYTKESPEVRAMVDKGMKYLADESNEYRLGGRCLIALVFFKEGMKDHKKVGEAVKACQETAAKGEAGDVYSNGLAIIFLCELDAKKHRNLIQFFVEAMAQRQKQHGGWGYEHKGTGDTSQSQYGCLGFWEAYQKGIPINAGAIDRAAEWLMTTQDPNGGWGYQGKVGGKKQDNVGCSMVSAAMGSLLICADLVGILEAGTGEEEEEEEEEEENPLPSVVKIASSRDQKRPRLAGSSIDRQRLLQTLRKGDAWMDENYTVSVNRYTSYYLYALERYKTLQAILEGSEDLEPAWYNKGVDYLRKSQSKDGSWTTGCGSGCDTAFTILFLIRSMQMSFGSLGEGVALGGRGLPSNIHQLKIRGGQLVVSQPKTEVSQLLSMLDDEKREDLDALINDSEALVMGDMDEKTARQMKQKVRSGSPAARILAVRALARTGDFDHVPTLLHAFAHQDPRLVQEARDGLRFISRRFEGFGLRKKFTQAEQFEALDKWKKWYQSVRPDVPLVID